MKIFLVLAITGFIGPLLPEIFRSILLSIKMARTRQTSEAPSPLRQEPPKKLSSPAADNLPSWSPRREPATGALAYKQWLTAPARTAGEQD